MNREYWKGFMGQVIKTSGSVKNARIIQPWTKKEAWFHDGLAMRERI